MSAAEYAPKPVEPAGLGAVVKDAGGALWVRADADGGLEWRRSGPALDDTWRDYADVDAVEVLSEGVES